MSGTGRWKLHAECEHPTWSAFQPTPRKQELAALVLNGEIMLRVLMPELCITLPETGIISDTWFGHCGLDLSKAKWSWGEVLAGTSVTL